MSRMPFIDNRNLRISIDKSCKEHDFDASQWVGNLMGAWGRKEIMPRGVLGEPTEYLFENLKIFGAEDFEGYLTSLYGNWRQLPPKEKQISHHDYSYMNLERGYLEK